MFWSCISQNFLKFISFDVFPSYYDNLWETYPELLSFSLRLAMIIGEISAYCVIFIIGILLSKAIKFEIKHKNSGQKYLELPMVLLIFPLLIYTSLSSIFIFLNGINYKNNRQIIPILLIFLMFKTCLNII